jgi:hypothetical protein
MFASAGSDGVVKVWKDSRVFVAELLALCIHTSWNKMKLHEFAHRDHSETARFFSILKSLPIELQMNICSLAITTNTTSDCHPSDSQLITALENSLT